MNTPPPPPQLYFDVHGRVGIRVERTVRTADQLTAALRSFATQEEVPGDIVFSAQTEPMPDAGLFDGRLAYSEKGLRFLDTRTQILRRDNRYHVNGPGRLHTALLPMLDLAMVSKGAATVHGASFTYRGRGLVIPDGGGLEPAVVMAKLMRDPAWSVMGHDWAFLTNDGELLAYDSPMRIKPLHQPLFPHVFVQPRTERFPARLKPSVNRAVAEVQRRRWKSREGEATYVRWSPGPGAVDLHRAFPGRTDTRTAPLAAVVYLERFEGARARLVRRDTNWMVDRVLGTFHTRLPSAARRVVAGVATGLVPWRMSASDKADVLAKALDGRHCLVLQIPSVYSEDDASDVAVELLKDLMGRMTTDEDY